MTTLRTFIGRGQFLCGQLKEMSVLYLLIGVSLVFAAGFLAAFIWAMRSDQYDDDYTPSVRILFEDKKPTEQSNK